MYTNYTNDAGDRATDETGDGSRRRFLAGSAAALGGLTVGGTMVSGSVIADDHDDYENEHDEMPDNEFEDDVDILNFARTLEFLEARFWKQGLDNIGEDDLLDSDPLQDAGDELRNRVFDELRTIQEHEEIHYMVLGDVIEDLGGDPVEEPEFDFGTAVEEPEEFLATGVTLEDTGVSAYAGAAPFIENEDLVPPALSIHSVEARHASFLRTLNNETGFPDAFDEARSRSEVLDAAGGFIVDGDDEKVKGDEDD